MATHGTNYRVPRAWRSYPGGVGLRIRTFGALVALAVVSVAIFLVLSRSDEGDSDKKGTERTRHANVVQLTCADAVESTSPNLGGQSDVVLDPLILVGASSAAARRPDAFNGHGYKVPVALPGSAVVTLSVPRASRGRVGLVYALAAQDRVFTRGARAADQAVRFTSCPEGGLTGWPGGLAVDRPRCATLIVEVGDGPPERHRVPLGRSC